MSDPEETQADASSLGQITSCDEVNNQKKQSESHDETAIVLTEQQEVKTRIATELLIADMDMSFQFAEIQKRESEQKIEEEEITAQHEEKEKRESERAVASEELSIQHEEKVKLASELLVANMTVGFQNDEKEKRDAELEVANAELIVANQELFSQNKEIKKRAEELVAINEKLTLAKENQKEHILGLQQMMFMTSHRLRQPVANILGMANLLDSFENSPEDISRTIGYMKQSALLLDEFTKELSTFIELLGRKGKEAA